MRRSGPPRLNRFPQRLDYTLIPAPLDLTLPLVDEKAHLPAIIVTPSSPIGEKDFSIAFLAPIPPPTFRERMTKLVPSVPKMPTVFHRRLPSQIKLPASPLHVDFEPAPSSWTLRRRACISILMAVLVFIMGCHLLLHSLVAYHPRLNYGSLGQAGEETLLTAVTAGNLDTFAGLQRNSVDTTSTPAVGGWFNLEALWAPASATDGKRSARFIISEGDSSDLESRST
ncbi:hypothetical protein BDW22DRAFT_1342239 [Trametopsis cervina]|nr:hypothetical protein BDW22DRAFT_1342239 [Trametopsis cervina]